MQPWLKWLLVGVLSVVLGIAALGNAVAASVAVTLVTGLFFVLAGVLQIGLSLQGGADHRVLQIALGALMLLLGVSFVGNPLQGTVSLALVVTILLAGSGILRLALAWAMRATQYFWGMLISGALSVALAGYILANFAAASVALLGLLLGVELIFNGAGLIVLGLFLRARA